MKTIAYVDPYVPAEWIAAHGLLPRRLSLRATKQSPMSGLPPGVCPYAGEFIRWAGSESGPAAVIVTTTCDQMRRAAEMIARDSALPLFLMHVPATWRNAAAHTLYRSELDRLGRFMLALGGETPSDERVTATMREYDAARSRLRASRGNLSAREYAQAITQYLQNGAHDLPPAAAIAKMRGVPLALVGGPLLANHFRIFGVIEDAGGCVVLDATETGEISLPAPFDRRAIQDAPLVELADAYFGGIPHVSRRPNSQLYQWLKTRMDERGVRGLILWRHVWCDLWHAEVQRMKEWAQMPLLSLDSGDEDAESYAQTRIQAFLAMFT